MKKETSLDFIKRVKVSFKSEKAYKIYSSLFCILASLILGLIILIIISPSDAFTEFGTMLVGGIDYQGISGVSSLLTNAAPLLCSGLAIIFAYKAGMFNIGAAGQYVMGVYGSLLFALGVKAPWYVCILFGMIFGAIWGAIPGLLKAFFNVNEVISGIMLNWIALFFMNYSFQTFLSGCVDVQTGSKTYAISRVNSSALIPDLGLTNSLGSYFNISIFIALIAALIIFVIIEKTTLGYKLKASGLNKHATRYAGINDKMCIIVSMAISGALAGLGASLYYLSGLEQWSVQASGSLPSVPRNGIVVAFISQISPIGVIFSSLFICLLKNGSKFMTQTIYPAEISDLITGIIVYFCGFSNFLIILLKKIKFKKKNKETNELDSLTNSKQKEEIQDIQTQDIIENDKENKEEL